MKMLLQLSDIPLWAWIVAAAAVVVVIIIIVIIATCAKKHKAANKQTKPAEKTTESKPAEKPETEAQPAPEEKPAEKPEAKPVEKDEPEKTNTIPRADKVYHVSKRKDDGKWQVKAAGGAKAIKLFGTQKEAIDYAKTLANNQDARIVVHKVDGSFRKDNY